MIFRQERSTPKRITFRIPTYNKGIIINSTELRWLMYFSIGGFYSSTRRFSFHRLHPNRSTNRVLRLSYVVFIAFCFPVYQLIFIGSWSRQPQVCTLRRLQSFSQDTFLLFGMSLIRLFFNISASYFSKFADKLLLLKVSYANEQFLAMTGLFWLYNQHLPRDSSVGRLKVIAPQRPLRTRQTQI